MRLRLSLPVFAAMILGLAISGFTGDFDTPWDMHVWLPMQVSLTIVQVGCVALALYSMIKYEFAKK